MQPSKSKPLPELRQELRLERGADTPTGAPTWLIIDPVANRYLQIEGPAYQLLSIWTPGQTAAELAAAARERFGLVVDNGEIEQFATFLEQQRLTLAPRDGGWKQFSDAANARDHGWISWAIHNYLYVKIPLFRPQRFLDRTAPLTALFFTRAFWISIAVIGLVGLYLVSRQWEAFKGTFLYLFSWEGAAIYGIALVIVKTLHELGHAYTATRYGCRVPSMGVALMVMMPMLYTDVTDAWRLRKRQQRIAIDVAGMAVELALACIATALWAFLPDGPMRSVAFIIATVGWVLSLFVNLNPLMRFDGYYLLSDMLGIDNLQGRAFEFGKWRMRELLFGLGAPPPEQQPQRTQRILTWYAWATWLYRLILFTGIALMVYHLAFKLLGIVLFLIEIVYFVLWPIGAELQNWWRNGAVIRKRPRSLVTAAIAVAAVLAAVVPWSTRIDVPAVVEAKSLARIYPPRPAEITAVHVTQGQSIRAGDPVVTLRSPELEHQTALASRKLALVELRLGRRGADDKDRESSLSLERERAALRSQLAGLAAERAELVVRSPISGDVAEFNLDVQPGRFMGRAEPIALVRGGDGLIARGYLQEHDLARISTSQTDHAGARFAPDNPLLARRALKLVSVASSSSQSIEIPELASQHGGTIAVRPKADKHRATQLVPQAASYLAVFEVADGAPELDRSERGVVHLEGRPESLLARAWRQTLRVLVRESGV